MAEPTSASVAHGLAFPPVSAKTGATIERPIRTPAMKLAACQDLARGSSCCTPILPRITANPGMVCTLAYQRGTMDARG